MTSIIKILSSKIIKKEMENKYQYRLVQEGDKKNLNQFRQPFVPRFFPRERRNNDDRRVQSLFKIICLMKLRRYKKLI